MTSMHFKTICFLILVIGFEQCKGINSLNTVYYKEVIRGETTTLDCNIEVDPNNEWHRSAVGSTYVTELMRGKTNRGDFIRFSIGTSGNYDLVIEHVERNDAGTYVCDDKDGRIITRFNLTVLDSLPDCSSSVHSETPIAENSCGVAPDIVPLSCSVRYSGVVAPVLKWVDIRGGNHSQNTRGGSHEVVNTVHANATWNNFIYKCLSEATRKSCYTVIPKPTYVFDTHEERSITCPQTVICSANSSQVCTYKWIHDGKEVSSDQKLELLPGSPSGEYQCLAECWLHDRYCSIRPYLLTYDFQMNNSYHGPSDWWIYSNVITAVIAIIFLGLMVKYRNRGRFTIKRKMTKWNFLEQFRRFVNSLWKGMHENEAKPPLMSIDIPGRVKGIAVLGKLIFISTFEKKTIDGFSTETYEHKMEIPVRGLKEARGMAACQQRKVIYITDRIGRDVIRVNIEQMETYHWTTVSNPDGISVTKDTHVVVACPFENAVKVFTFDGKELRKICLSSDNKGHLYHGWQMRDSNFLVCYGPESDDPDDHQHMRICIVKFSHRIDAKTECYINEAIYPGTSDKIWPMRVAETERGGVLVISSVDKKVLLFDSNLQKIKVLIHTSDNFLLNRMCLVEDKGKNKDHHRHRLYISERSEDWLSSRILIYELTDDELDASLDVPSTSSDDPLINK